MKKFKAYTRATSHDIIHLFIVRFFLIITSLMQEAYDLKNEHDLTV